MRNKIIDLLFVVLAAVFVFLLSEKPVYNWDMIAYMGVSVEYSEHDLQKVHDSVYHTLRQEVSPEVYRGLTENYDDRAQCLKDASIFGKELSFFRTKPLYTLWVFLLHKAGVHLVLATLIPSIIACFLIILLVYHWLCHFLQRPLAFVAAASIAMLPIFAMLDRYSTPDAMSNLFVLLTLYTIATKKPVWMLILSLLLATLSRIDNFVLAIVIAYFLYLKNTKNILWKSLVVGSISLICVVGVPMLMGDRADWFTQFAFLFSVKDYIQHWRDVIYILRTDVLYLVLMAVAALLILKANREIKTLVQIVVTTVVIRLFLFPSLQERFFAAYEFVVIIALLSFVQQRYGRQEPKQTFQLRDS